MSPVPHGDQVMRTGRSEENPICSVPLVLGAVHQTTPGTFALGMNAIVGLGSGVLWGEGTWTTALCVCKEVREYFLDLTRGRANGAAGPGGMCTGGFKQ